MTVHGSYSLHLLYPLTLQRIQTPCHHWGDPHQRNYLSPFSDHALYRGEAQTAFYVDPLGHLATLSCPSS